MKSKSILITDTLFVSKKHVQYIENAGFTVHREPNPKLTEQELITALQDKVGYILGGIETVTKKVLESATQLKAIAFTGSGYSEFIPAHDEAKKRNILISNAPGGNADAVAEFTVTQMLMMTREMLSLGRAGTTTFKTTASLKDKTVGIYGMGIIGQLVVRYLLGLGVREINYYSPTRKFHLENSYGIKFVSRDDLFTKSQILTIHASKTGAKPHLTDDDLQQLPKGALLINNAYPEAVDLYSLERLLRAGKLTAAFDRPPGDNFSDIPMNVCYYSNSQTAFNTIQAVNTVGDMAVRSLVNLLLHKNDSFCVNNINN
jgi:phosphoglycerate dehydrogenase-like enzyme